MQFYVLVLLVLLPLVTACTNFQSGCLTLESENNQADGQEINFNYDNLGNVCPGTVVGTFKYTYQPTQHPPQAKLVIATPPATGTQPTVPLTVYSGSIDGITPANTFSITTSGTTSTYHLDVGLEFTDQNGNTDEFLITGSSVAGGSTMSFYFAPNAAYTGYADVGPLAVTFSPASCTFVGADPLFVGFHGQHFKVYGVPERVFNLLSMPQLQLNSRFITLDEGQAMTPNDMVAARIQHMRHNRQLPLTVAASHGGVYMGELGFKVSGVRVFVAAGEYESGFASVTVNGQEVPVSNASVSVADGVAFITRRSPYSVTFSTSQLTMRIVNSDKFVNIDNVALLVPYTADLPLSGLLGVSANPDWTADFKGFQQRAIDESMLQGDDIFGNDFQTNQYNAAK